MSLKPEILDLADKLKTGLELNNQTGVGSGSDSLYKDNLPENITIEQAVAVGDYNTTFNAAGTYAAGQLAIDAMKGNKNLERVTFDIPMCGKDNLTVNIDRRKTFPNHLTGGSETEKFGVTSVSYEVYAGKNGGQLKKARLAIGELAAEALK